MPEREPIVVEQAPFDGPVTVEVDGERHAIGRSVAARIEVAAPADAGAASASWS